MRNWTPQQLDVLKTWAAFLNGKPAEKGFWERVAYHVTMANPAKPKTDSLAEMKARS